MKRAIFYLVWVLAIVLNVWTVRADGTPGYPASQAAVQGGQDSYGWVTPATLAGSLANLLPYNMPPPITWLSASSFLGNSNNYPPATWPDISGQGNTFYATGVNEYYVHDTFDSLYSPSTINGASPWGFVNTNYFQRYPALNTNFTMMIVLKNAPAIYANPGGAYHIASAGINGTSILDGFALWGYRIGTSFGGAVSMQTHSANTWAVIDGMNKYTTLLFRFDGVYDSCWQDGFSVMQNSVQGTYTGTETILGATNNLYLFNQAITGAYPYPGSIAEVLIWTNALNNAQLSTISAFYAKKYGRSNQTVILDGDSWMQGNVDWDNGSMTGKTLTYDVAQQLPLWDVYCTAVGGRTSAGTLTNELIWINSYRDSGTRVVVSDCGVVNDIIYAQAPNAVSMTVPQAAAQLPLTEANVLAQCSIAHSNHYAFIPTTMISGFWETNGFKTNYNTWLRANLTNFDGINDWAAIPVLGADGAYTSSTYFYEAPAGLHANWLGATYQATNIANVVASVTGAHLSGLTNSAANFLTAGLFRTMPALGFVSVSCVVTNNAIVWLTNQTSHYCVPMGNTTGLWTNYDNALLPVNLGDSICVTNPGSPNGWTLVSSYFQNLH